MYAVPNKDACKLNICHCCASLPIQAGGILSRGHLRRMKICGSAPKQNRLDGPTAKRNKLVQPGPLVASASHQSTKQSLTNTPCWSHAVALSILTQPDPLPPTKHINPSPNLVNLTQFDLKKSERERTSFSTAEARASASCIMPSSALCSWRRLDRPSELTVCPIIQNSSCCRQGTMERLCKVLCCFKLTSFARETTSTHAAHTCACVRALMGECFRGTLWSTGACLVLVFLLRCRVSFKESVLSGGSSRPRGRRVLMRIFPGRDHVR